MSASANGAAAWRCHVCMYDLSQCASLHTSRYASAASKNAVSSPARSPSTMSASGGGSADGATPGSSIDFEPSFSAMEFARDSSIIADVPCGTSTNAGGSLKRGRRRLKILLHSYL